MGLAEDVKNLYCENDKITDHFGIVHLKSPNNEFVSIHRMMLAARSKVLLKKLDENSNDKASLVIPEASIKELRILQKYFYTNDVPEDDISFKILTIANKYGFEDLHEKCVQGLESRFNSKSNETGYDASTSKVSFSDSKSPITILKKRMKIAKLEEFDPQNSIPAPVKSMFESTNDDIEDMEESNIDEENEVNTSEIIEVQEPIKINKTMEIPKKIAKKYINSKKIEKLDPQNSIPAPVKSMFETEIEDMEVSNIDENNVKESTPENTEIQESIEINEGIETPKKATEKDFKCDICKKTFSTKLSLSKHKSTVHSGKTFECDECNKCFTLKYSLAHHKNSVHLGKKPFKCDDCNAAFTAKSNLERHKDAVHLKKKPFQCDDCEKAFSFKSNLISHKNTFHNGEKPFQCNDCESTFPTKSNLQRHIKNIHLSDPKPKVAKIPKMYKCEQPDCNFETKWSKSLTKHEKSHINIICDVCFEVFNGEKAQQKYEKHNKIHESHECDLCFEKFDHEVELQRHYKKCYIMHKSKEDMENLTKVYKQKLENQKKQTSTKQELETKPKIQELTLRKPRKQEFENGIKEEIEPTKREPTRFVKEAMFGSVKAYDEHKKLSQMINDVFYKKMQ